MDKKDQVKLAFEHCRADSGYSWDLQDCVLICKFVKESYGVEICTLQALEFWRWRCRQHDAAWFPLGERSGKEVAEWFAKFMAKFGTY